MGQNGSMSDKIGQDTNVDGLLGFHIFLNPIHKITTVRYSPFVLFFHSQVVAQTRLSEDLWIFGDESEFPDGYDSHGFENTSIPNLRSAPPKIPTCKGSKRN
jgi:hypothetical protein